MTVHMPLSREERARKRKFSLVRIRINSQGYDANGGYWGIGKPLFHAMSDDGITDTRFRANDRNHAKAIIRDTSPNARFYR